MIDRESVAKAAIKTDVALEYLLKPDAFENLNASNTELLRRILNNLLHANTELEELYHNFEREVF